MGNDPPLLIVVLKRSYKYNWGFIFFLGRFHFLGWWYSRQKTFPGPMRSYSVKQNHIGSEVSEILRYKQTTRLLLVVLFTPLVKNFPILVHSFFLLKKYTPSKLNYRVCQLTNKGTNNLFSSLASKPINIRWFRTCSKPY